MKALRLTSLYLTALAASLTVSQVQAADISPALKKNADILQTIMQTAFKEDENARLSSVQYSYLAGQGILFQANAQGSRNVFHFSGSGFAPVAPVAPVAPLPDGDFEFELNTGEIERLTEAAQEMAERIKQQSNYSFRIAAEKQRVIARELHDVESELRDIEFNKSISKLDKEQQQQLAMLQQKATLLKEKQAEAEKEAATTRQQLEEQRNKQLAEQQKQTAAMVKTVGEKFSQILCDYGASLREIPDAQYISLQVNSRNSEGRYYWVVKKADINQCMTGKIKAKDLLTKANTYQF